jgi:hypothetical protein
VRRRERAHHRSFLKDPFTGGRGGPAHNTHLCAHTPPRRPLWGAFEAGPRRGVAHVGERAGVLRALCEQIAETREG